MHKERRSQEMRERLIRETDQVSPWSWLDRVSLPRVIIVCEDDVTVLARVCSGSMVAGVFLGRPGALLVVLRRGSDLWWVSGGAGFLTHLLMRVS